MELQDNQIDHQKHISSKINAGFGWGERKLGNRVKGRVTGMGEWDLSVVTQDARIGGEKAEEDISSSVAVAIRRLRREKGREMR